jgi:hypothetical protein
MWWVPTVGSAVEDPLLPEPIGDLNDYGAQLGESTRRELQSQIDRLRGRAGVRVTVLITLLDPFSDPVRYAREIWERWELDQEQGQGQGQAVLLVFVREGERWAFAWRASPDLMPRLQGSWGVELRRVVDELLQGRRVAQAARRALGALVEVFDVAPPAAPPETPVVRRGVWPYAPTFGWIVGVGLGLGALYLGLRWIVRWICPQCGRKLRRRSPGMPHLYGRRRRNGSRRSLREWVYYCRRCGYHRSGIRRRGGQRAAGARTRRRS